MKPKLCPFKIGDHVIFSPSKRTSGLYQNVDRFGVEVGQSYEITDIKDGTYLYFGSGKGGWPWTEFTAVPAGNNRINASKYRH
jgi:hypothetical protein